LKGNRVITDINFYEKFVDENLHWLDSFGEQLTKPISEVSPQIYQEDPDDTPIEIFFKMFQFVEY
jgi:hypothetical protein